MSVKWDPFGKLRIEGKLKKINKCTILQSMYFFYELLQVIERIHRIVHLLVLTRVLIYRKARNEKIRPVCGFCECGNDLHRSIKRRVIHSNSARQGVLFCETRRSHTGVD